MELANIEKTVEKYLNATTTLQEEAALKNYFTKGNVAPHLQEYAYLFTYFEKQKEEVFTKEVVLKPINKRKISLQWLSVAASIVLVLSVFIGKEQYNQYQQKKKAEIMYQQVSKGLELLSKNLRKGEEAVANLYAYENTVLKILK